MTIDDVYGDDEVASLYDLFFMDYGDDLTMHEQFARRGDTPSLELGAGSGRLALHLARAGIDVVALDASPPMLARLRAALDGETVSRVRCVEADMRSFDLEERFDVIHCAANTFQHLLTSEDQVATLRCVASHLTHGGIFVAKVASPAAVDWGEDDGSVRLRETRTDRTSGETVMRFDAMRASPNEQIVRRTFIYDRTSADGGVRRRTQEVALRFFAPHELALLLERSGLHLLNLYGDFELSPFDERSDSMVFVAGLEA